MSPPTITDHSLVFRVRDGDEDAAIELYGRYAARVFGLVQKQMADHLKAQVDPEDIVQSVFRSVFRGVSSAAYDAPQGGTLWKLIAVVAVNKVRRNGRNRSAAKRDARRTEPLDEISATGSSSTSPEELECALRESLEGLKPVEQEVVQLRVQAYSVDEIAQKLGKSRRTIERLLQRAREELLRMVDEDEFY